MSRGQSGAGGLFIAVILLLIVGGVLAAVAFLQARGQGERTTQDDQRFEAIKAAMVQFVAANGRLPCPANPTADTGAAEPETASATCTYPQGTVPWKTLGVRRDDAIDAWGWKISYRVYTGTAGSLTQANGASLVNCDTTEAAGWAAGVTPVSGSSGGTCRGTKNTLQTEFLAGKGLTITWFGTAVTDAAYVLISHGPSGLGGYTSVPPSMQTTLPASANELANLSAAGPFVATNRTMSGIAPSDAAHFDDVLAYQKLSDLVRLAGVGARDWDDSGTASETLTAANIATATGSTPTAGSDLGVSSINFQTSRVTGLTAGAARNLTFDTSGGVESLGIEGGGTGISSAVNEAVRIELKNKANKLGVTLNNFGSTSFFGSWNERARFSFYDGASLVSTVTKQGCNADGGLASFTIDLGASQFDKVEITPLVSTTHPFFGTVITTTFWLAAFTSCTSGACQTSLYNAGNACP